MKDIAIDEKAELLGQEILDLISDNDMKIDVSKHIGKLSPRKYATGDWIGVEVRIPTHLIMNSINNKLSIKEVISKWYKLSNGNELENYCFAVGLENNDSNELYEIISKDKAWNAFTIGFIEVKKQAFFDDYGYKDIVFGSETDKNIEKVAKKIIETEMNIYNAWTNNNVYDILLTDLNNGQTKMANGIYNALNIIDDNFIHNELRQDVLDMVRQIATARNEK